MPKFIVGDVIIGKYDDDGNDDWEPSNKMIMGTIEYAVVELNGVIRYFLVCPKSLCIREEEAKVVK